jgi:hypothetical protein
MTVAKREEQHMGKMATPNQVYFCGAAIISTILGLLTGSWFVFGMSLALLLALSVQPGQDRPASRRCSCR